MLIRMACNLSRNEAFFFFSFALLYPITSLVLCNMVRQMVKALLDSHLSLMQKPLCSLLFNIFLLLLLMFDFLPFIMYMQGDGPCSLNELIICFFQIV